MARLRNWGGIGTNWVGGMVFFSKIKLYSCTELNDNYYNVIFMLISDQVPTASSSPNPQASEGKLFNLKKWNAVAMWSWDVECDTCAICRVQVSNKAV